MAFQRFIGQRERALSPKVSILARGLIEFNDGATRKFALNRFNYAILYYDQDARQIGIEFTNNSSERGAVRVIKKPNGIVIPAGTFLGQNRLLHSKSTKYDVLYSGEHDMYIVQLPPSIKADEENVKRDKRVIHGGKEEKESAASGEDKRKRVKSTVNSRKTAQSS